MKAVYYERFGPARDVLRMGEWETPAPGDGEVLVRLHASGVNPSDVKARAGARAKPGETPAWPQIIPHSDGAGVVEAVGPGVDPSRIGERVWIWNGQWRRPFGTCATHIRVPAAQAAPLPEGTSFAEGACLGIPAMTAHACVLGDGPIRGQTVLVTGGAGAVGRYAIQFSKLGGAMVIATVSGDAKAEAARAAGADHIVNYREDDVGEAVLALTDGRGVERIVDVEFGGNLADSEKLIRPNGVIAAYASARVMRPEFPFYSLMFRNVTLRAVLVYLLPEAAREAAVRDINGYLEAGRLSHALAATFPLEETAAAHDLVESGERMGCVVVEAS